MVDEGAQPGSEAVGLGEVDEMAATLPLVDLRERNVREGVVALLPGQPLAEQEQARYVDALCDLLDPRLQLVGIGPHQLLEVAERDVTAHVLGVQRQRAKRLGHEVQAHAVLHRREGVGERRAAKCRLELLDERSEGPDVERAVDVDDAAHGIARRVDRRDRAGHRVPDNDRPLDAESFHEVVDLGRDLGQRAGRPGALALAGQVDRDRVHVVAEPIDDRSPDPALKRVTGEEHDGHAGTVLLVGKRVLREKGRHEGAFRRKELCNNVP